MHDRGRSLGRYGGQQALVHLVDDGHLTALRLLELPVPAAELALDVALLAAQVTETDSVGVDGVDLGQHVDE